MFIFFSFYENIFDLNYFRLYADGILLLLVFDGVDGGEGLTGSWLLIVKARWSDGRFGVVVEVLFDESTGRRALTVDDDGVGMRLVGVVGGLTGRFDVDAALNWLTIDLTRLLPSDIEESTWKGEFEWILIIINECVNVRAHKLDSFRVFFLS